MKDFEKAHQIQYNLNYLLKFPINSQKPCKTTSFGSRHMRDRYTMSQEHVIDKMLSQICERGYNDRWKLCHKRGRMTNILCHGSPFFQQCQFVQDKFIQKFVAVLSPLFNQPNLFLITIKKISSASNASLLVLVFLIITFYSRVGRDDKKTPQRLCRSKPSSRLQ